MIDRIGPRLGATPCACGRCRTVPTLRFARTASLADRVADEARIAGTHGATLVFDARTEEACGTAVARGLRALGVYGPCGSVETVRLERAPDGDVHADDATVDRLFDTLRTRHRNTLPVAIGAGTVNDVVKAAACRLDRPYVAIATAPSMNGYTSAIAAITERGLKKTLPSRPPVAVYADPRVLALAPARLAVSGLADLASKPVSTADWKLSGALWDTPYCPAPARIANDALELAASVSDRIGGCDEEARGTLLEALVLSGIAMAVAGSSSPASGGEHLVSHFLDMTAATEPDGPRRPALHGEQVGVATLVTVRLYAALSRLDADAVDWEAAERRAPDLEAAERRLGGLPQVTPELRRRFVDETRAKLERIGSPGVRLHRIRSRWERWRRAVATDVEAANRVGSLLRAAGAPLEAHGIGVTRERFADACRNARFMRNRYTVLDLVDDLGLMDDLLAVD